MSSVFEDGACVGRSLRARGFPSTSLVKGIYRPIPMYGCEGRFGVIVSGTLEHERPIDHEDTAEFWAGFLAGFEE